MGSGAGRGLSVRRTGWMRDKHCALHCPKSQQRGQVTDQKLGVNFSEAHPTAGALEQCPESLPLSPRLTEAWLWLGLAMAWTLDSSCCWNVLFWGRKSVATHHPSSLNTQSFPTSPRRDTQNLLTAEAPMGTWTTTGGAGHGVLYCQHKRKQNLYHHHPNNQPSFFSHYPDCLEVLPLDRPHA